MFRSFGEKFKVNQTAQPVAQVRRREESKPRKPSAARRLYLKIDPVFFVTVASIIVFGVIVVWSASYDFSKLYFGNSMHIFYRQLLALFIGGVGAVFLAFFDYHRLKGIVLPMMGVVIASLLIVLIFGEERLGAKRTMLWGSLQPSEIAKLAMIIYLAVWLDAKQDDLHKITFGLVPLALILGFVSTFILLQPDLSAIFTIIFIGVVMFVLAGGDLKQIGILLFLTGLMSWVAMTAYPTGADRVHEFIAGLMDPAKGSDHIKYSFDAFYRGGLFGVGLGNSEAKLTSLPVPHTDSVFAVIGEEFGMLGALGLVILFTVFLWRGLIISRKAPDKMGRLLAAGLTIWIAFEAFINMAGMVNLMPFPGNVLPFTSAGGSNLLVSLLAVGIILNVSRQAVETKEGEKLFGEVVNLRWRNRRRSVPRVRRSASSKSNR